MKKWLMRMGFVLWPTFLLGNAQTFNRFLHATFAHAQKDFARSRSWFEKLDTQITHAEHPWHLKGYTQLLTDMHETFKITQFIPLLDAHFKHDVSVQLAIVKTLQQMGNLREAQERILEVQQRNPANPELTVLAVQAAVAAKNIPQAIALLDRFVNTHPRKGALAMFYLMKAQLHYAHKQPKLALSAINECIECNPKFHNAWILKAQLEKELGHLVQAQESYKEFIARAPRQKPSNSIVKAVSLPGPVQAEAAVTVQQPADQKGTRALRDQALQLYRYALQNPTDDQARVAAAQTLMSAGYAQLARDLLQRALERQPTEPNWYLLMLASVQNETDLTEVEQRLKNLSRQSENGVVAHFFLAQLYLASLDFDKADQSLERLLRQVPDPLYQASALHLQALLALKQQNIPLAISLLSHVYELPSDTPKSDLLLLSLYRQTDRKQERALQIVDHLLDAHPYNTRLLYIKSELLLQLNKLTDAIATLQTVTAMEPDNEMAWCLLCKTLHANGNHKDAARLLAPVSRRWIVNGKVPKKRFKVLAEGSFQ